MIDILTHRITDTPIAVANTQDGLGESILWDHRAGSLHWIDIHEGELWSWVPFGGAPQRKSLGQRVGAIGLREANGFVLGLERGFALLDDFDSEPRDFVLLPDLPRSARLNDGRVDPFGRFVCGGMDEGTPQQHIASLYLLDEALQVDQLVRDEIACINALSWSPDGRTMYYSDMPNGTIEAFEYSKDGLSNRRPFADLKLDPGLADGSCVDADGYVWNAQWGGARLTRYATDGTVDRVVSLPVSNPTCVCFGGSDLDILFITSARFGLSEAQLRNEPDAGAILAFRPGVTGKPEYLFAG